MSERSASPPREEAEPKAKKQKTGGFKWKEKKAKDEDKAWDEPRDGGRLERGYRNRSPRRDSYRERERERERERDRSPRRNHREHGREPRRETDGDRPRPDRDADHEPPRPQRTEEESTTDRSFPLASTATTTTTATTTPPTTSKPQKEKKKDKPPKHTPATTNEPMIIVNINDRLGTKAAIPCLASDSIKAFKAVVAAHIGRQPHEIMLKRQGERPFKDALTLQDYGVSNGVQLDLELDTGD